MKKTIKFLALSFFTFALVISCKDKNNYTKMDNSPATSKNELHKIVVTETIDGGTYSYVKVEEDGNSYWMAIPNTPLVIGSTYYYEGGMVMKDFISKQLDKTFDFITFAEGIRSTEIAAPIKHSNDEHVHTPMAEPVTEKIEPAKNGVSLANLFEKKQAYNKQAVIVKGKVVKVNNGIMDKNWVHIEDGTQFEGEKSITITTLEEVKVGDIVTFKGNLILDKDFGQGYVYDVLLEEGIIIK